MYLNIDCETGLELTEMQRIVEEGYWVKGWQNTTQRAAFEKDKKNLNLRKLVKKIM